MNHNDQDDDKDMDKRASVEQKTKKKFRPKIIPKTKSNRRAGGAEKTRRPPSERSTRRGGRRGRYKKNKRDTTKSGRKIVFKRKTVDKSKRDTKNAERKVQDAQRPHSARMPRDSKKSSSVKKPSKNLDIGTESAAAKSTTRIVFKRKVVDESKKDDRDAGRVQDAQRPRSAREPRNSKSDPKKTNSVKKPPKTIPVDAKSIAYSKMRQIFVGGLSQKTSKKSVREYFSAFGDVKDVVLAYDRKTKLPKRFAFVEFDSTSAVDEVLKRRKAHKFHEMDGKRVEIQRMRTWNPKECTADGMPGKMFNSTWQQVIDGADIQAKNVCMMLTKSMRTKIRVTVFAPSRFNDVEGRTWRVQVVFHTYVDMPREGPPKCIKAGHAYVNNLLGGAFEHHRHEDIFQLFVDQLFIQSQSNEHAGSEDVRNKIRHEIAERKKYIFDSCGLRSFDKVEQRKCPVLVPKLQASAPSWTPSRSADSSDIRATQTSVPDEEKTAEEANMKRLDAAKVTSEQMTMGGGMMCLVSIATVAIVSMIFSKR